MNLRIKSVLAVVLALTVSAAYGQLTVNLAGGNGVSYSGEESDAMQANEGFPELADAKTFDLFVTTPDDILVVDFSLDVSAGRVFQDTTTLNPYGAQLGSDTGPAPAGAIANNPQLGADSWVGTPGSGTACAQVAGACPGFADVDDAVIDNVAHFDSSGEGAQTDFNFARITLIPDETGAMAADFSGFVQVANQPSPIVEEFSFTLGGVVPEPGSMSLLMTALLGGLALVRKRR